jgi:hypothetical protein
MNKRVAVIALVIGFLMLMQPTQAFAAQAFTTVTCANPEGNQVTRQIGWDNSNVYFSGKGDIPRLYCEGGHAGSYTTYISDTLEADSPLRWFNGITPTPSPTPEPEPSASPEATLEPSTEPEPSLEPSASPTLEPSTEPTPEVSPTAATEPSPTPEPEPTQTPDPTPTSTQTEQPQPTDAPTVQASLPPIEPSATPIPETTLEPTPEPSEVAPIPEPSVNPEVQTIELPENLQVIGIIQLAAAAEAVMNVGADMTEEEREESQIIAVAAIIISQIAGSIRRATK